MIYLLWATLVLCYLYTVTAADTLDDGPIIACVW